MQNSELKQLVLELSEIERTALKQLGIHEIHTLESLAQTTELNKDAVRRVIEWLKEKKLIQVQDLQRKAEYSLTKTGKENLEKGLPERRMIQALQEKTLNFKELQEKTKLNSGEFASGLGVLKQKNFITIQSGKIEISEVGKEFAGSEWMEEKILNNPDECSLDQIQGLIKRGLLEKKEVTENSIQISEFGIQAKEILETIGSQREFNIQAPVQPLYLGKAQPYNQFLKLIRKKLLELGFTEMKERLIVQEFYNFDVLFQPQNHPARQWTDSYQLKQPTHGKLPDKKIVDKIKAAHETGGLADSTGWGYEWSTDIASRVMPTAHGTAMDARQMCEGVEFPKKYFVINRCFRPDVLDATHLVEFNQLDCFMVGPGINFRSLLHVFKQLAYEIAGAKEVKFTTAYFPFTEPSCELSIKHPQLGWMEVAGGGVLRPEITENLGIKEPAIAWGMGIDRLAMAKLGIKDIRYLFSDNLDWLRKSKMVVE
ncbi:MAG: phenylalanine--tRNA ligase subunit alpha [Candidatus Diapherotrites archaeon]|nr:phenylalanine--tRNA ligase subunit alpha [Candidatus Diapherotrites archaeon]